MLKKFIGARSGFYEQLFSLLLPIVFQNLITSAVSMADVLMLGRVNQTVLSASSLAGQVQFILNIIYFGLASALTILASQYWGRDDRPTIARIFGIGFLISVPVSTAVSVMALICPHWVISIWTNVPELASAGSSYLRWVAFSYFFMGITQPYLSVMKSCERVKMTTAVSVFTLCLNVVLNAVLIFGLCGLPQMGITGAALATSIARGVELLICTWDYARQKVFPRGIRLMFSIPRELAGDFGRYCLPAFINDAMWGLAFNMNSVIMGHLGSDIVAANSIVTVARDLVTTVGFGIAAASSIMLGKEIGSGNLSLARHDASSLLRTTVVVGVFEGLIHSDVFQAKSHSCRLSSSHASGQYGVSDGADREYVADRIAFQVRRGLKLWDEAGYSVYVVLCGAAWACQCVCFEAAAAGGLSSDVHGRVCEDAVCPETLF